MNIVLFEDELVSQLAPVTTGKAAFVVSCGSYRLVDLAARLGAVRCLVRPHLRAVEAESFPQMAFGGGVLSGDTLLLNARTVPSVDILDRLRRVIEDAQEGVAQRDGVVSMALIKRRGLSIPDDWKQLAVLVQQMNLRPLPNELPLLEYPHDIVRHHMACLHGNLEERLRGDGFREAADGLFIADEVTLGPHLVTDSRHGPIVIDRGAAVGPFCYLTGPAYIGPNSRLIEHAALKDGVSLGHTTKVGGEVEASIIEPYTNKQHHGFLGHSYVGSWINLGAGTSNSDLKNTYGTVNMDYRGRKVPTGMQFVGSFIGDYSKSAINTGIFTGKTIGVCSMMYGFVTTNVPSFVNYARSFGQVTELPPEVMVATQQRMFARRNVQQRPCDVQLLHDMYELTRHERQIAGEPLSL